MGDFVDAVTNYTKYIPLKVRAISAKIIYNKSTYSMVFEWYLNYLTVIHFSR